MDNSKRILNANFSLEEEVVVEAPVVPAPTPSVVAEEPVKAPSKKKTEQVEEVTDEDREDSN